MLGSPTSGSTLVRAAEFGNVECEGSYSHHLQGICVDEQAIYWCFTTTLVKTDSNGKILHQVPVANHHGDLCIYDGKVYVAVNLGKFNDPQGNADSWVYVYHANDLALHSKHAVPEVVYGAGGIGARDGQFFVVGGLPDGIQENYVYEYAPDLTFVKRHVIPSGPTRLGIQTATFAYDRWWFGCYGAPEILLVTNADFALLGRYEYSCSLGIVPLAGRRFFTAIGGRDQEKNTGTALLALADDKSGLRAEAGAEPSAGPIRFRRIRHCEVVAAEVRDVYSGDRSVVAKIEGQRFSPTVRLFEAASGQPLGPALEMRAHRVTALAIGQDNRTLATAVGNLSNDWGRVQVWNGKTGAAIAAYQGEPLGEVLRMFFRGDDKLLDIVSGPAGGR